MTDFFLLFSVFECSGLNHDVRRPCSDFTDMLRRLTNCRIIIIIIIINVAYTVCNQWHDVRLSDFFNLPTQRNRWLIIMPASGQELLWFSELNSRNNGLTELLLCRGKRSFPWGFLLNIQKLKCNGFKLVSIQDRQQIRHWSLGFKLPPFITTKQL